MLICECKQSTCICLLSHSYFAQEVQSIVISMSECMTHPFPYLKNRESKLTCYLWRWFSSTLAAICCVLLVLWMMSFLSHNGQRWCRYCVSTKYSAHGSTAEMFSILRCLVTCYNTTAATSNYVTVHYLCMKLRFPFTLFLALYCNHW